jgi:hypothetical protein
MPKFPGGDAEAERAAELVAQIHIIVHHAAEPFVRDRAMASAKAFTSDPEAVRTMVRAMGKSARDRGASWSEVKAVMKEVRQALQNVDALLMLATVETVPFVVAAWVQTLMTHVRQGKSVSLLRADILDDAMLPPGDDAATFFDMMMAESPIDGDLGREILRAVKSKLPEGKCLPEELIEFLCIRKIFVVPP